MNVKDIIEVIKTAKKDNTKFFSYYDMVIIGENTSGKSNIIKGAIKALELKNVYFIDSRNRVIPSKGNLINDQFSNFEVQNIVRTRILLKNFNKNDVFTNDSGKEVVLGELILNSGEYTNLFKRILNIDMRKETMNDLISDGMTQIWIDNTDLSKISSGIQSKLRILMEVNFANKNNCEIVFIDEFDSNLDYKAASTFFSNLKKEYSNIRFIITTHNIYTLKGVKDADIVKIYKLFGEIEDNICEICDSNDLDNLESIDRKLFGISGEITVKDKNDIFLGNILKLVITNKNITTSDEGKLISINEKDLTMRQKILRSYILERLEKI